jgi:hypothetical protein
VKLFIPEEIILVLLLSFRVDEVKYLVEKAGLCTPKNKKLNMYNYEFDVFCPKFIKCHPSQRSDLAQSTLVKRHHIVLQVWSMEFKSCTNLSQMEVACASHRASK